MDWLVARQGYFNGCFADTVAADSDGQLKDHEQVIAYWLSTFVRKLFPELLLEIIRVHHQRLTRPFTQLLAHAVWTDEMKTLDPRFSSWVSLLLSQGEHMLHQSMWAYLLQICRIPAHTVVALRLFEILTEPRIYLRKHLEFPELAVLGGKSKRLKNGHKTSIMKLSGLSKRVIGWIRPGRVFSSLT